MTQQSEVSAMERMLEIMVKMRQDYKLEERKREAERLEREERREREDKER